MKAPTPSPEQNAAVAARYDGDLPFTAHNDMDIQNALDAHRWLSNDKLVGLVDESQGGIIGYVHRDHVDRIVALLNVAIL